MQTLAVLADAQVHIYYKNFIRLDNINNSMNIRKQNSSYTRALHGLVYSGFISEILFLFYVTITS